MTNSEPEEEDGTDEEEEGRNDEEVVGRNGETQRVEMRGVRAEMMRRGSETPKRGEWK